MNLFIDTNIFLSFFHLTSDDLEELRKLAVLTDQKKVRLYLTGQVLSEFRRNRENKIADALKGLKEQRLNLKFPQMCKDYTEYGVLRGLQKKYEQAHSALLHQLAKDVAEQKLKADETLKELFGKATVIETTDDIVSRARLRMQVGNPPGKDGSLGDAITWEALLEAAEEGEDLHFITDDGDYVSVLDEARFKDFLAVEWQEKRKSKIVFHPRLSSFFKDNFPKIKLASDAEKELAIEGLASAGSFAASHSAVAKLNKYTQFTVAQTNDIVRAAISNSQVTWIIGDEDVKSFIERVVAGRDDELEKNNLAELRRVLKKATGAAEDAPPPEDDAPPGF